MSQRVFNPERAMLAELELAAKRSIGLTNELIAASRKAVAAWKDAPYRSTHELNVAMRRLDKLVGSPDR